MESTNLVFHLNAMLKILVRETSQACFTDDDKSDDKEIVLGPCMEYLINRQGSLIIIGDCEMSEWSWIQSSKDQGTWHILYKYFQIFRY